MPAAPKILNRFVKYSCNRQVSCLLLCLAMSWAWADEFEELHSAEVTVPDQARSTQNSVLGKVFANVLVKLSGQRILPDNATAELLGTRARSSLQSVTYHHYNLPIDEQTEFSELRLQARFNNDSVNNTLVFLGLPRWPVERRQLLFIMAIESDNERRLISTDDGFLAFVASDTARARGLPLEVSLEQAGDDFDISWLQEIWGGFTETPLAESRAKGFDGVLLASASLRGGRWQLRWNMAIAEREWTWSLRDNDLYRALANGIHGAADRMSAHAAIQPADQGRWLEPVEVANIRSNREYLRCMAYLQGLDLVKRVEIISVQGEKIRFQLELSAAPEYLHQSIERGELLELVGASMGTGARIYQLVN